MCSITSGVIDMAEPDCWFYLPDRHKTKNRDHMQQRVRQIPLGPRCMEILRARLRPQNPDAFLFSPAERMAELRQVQRAKRKTRVQPSQQDRSTESPRKTPGLQYTTSSLTHAIAGVHQGRDQAGLVTRVVAKDTRPARVKGGLPRIRQGLPGPQRFAGDANPLCRRGAIACQGRRASGGLAKSRFLSFRTADPMSAST